MNRLDRWKARKVASIQGKDAFDAVDVHGGNEPCVMHLNAGDGVSNEELAPDEMHCGIVGKHWDLAFDHSRPSISLMGSQAKAVAIQRPRQNVPELSEILRGVAGEIARCKQKIDGTNDKLRLRCCSDIPAKKHIAVEQGLDFTSYEWSP